MKILVLENIGHIEEVLSAYLRQKYPSAEIDIVYHAKDEEEKILVSKLVECDILSIASILDGMGQFESMLELINTIFKKELRTKTLQVDFIHTTQSFHLKLMQLEIAHQKILKELIEEKVVLNNVSFQIHEIHQEGVSFFKKLQYTFDIVPMYFNEQYKVFYQIRQEIIPNLNSFLYLQEIKFESKIKPEIIPEVKKIDNTFILSIAKKEKGLFFKILKEINAKFKYDLEDKELTYTLFNKTEADKIISFKEEAVDFLDKILP